jgi:hypothetical protein
MVKEADGNTLRIWSFHPHQSQHPTHRTLQEVGFGKLVFSSFFSSLHKEMPFFSQEKTPKKWKI